MSLPPAKSRYQLGLMTPVVLTDEGRRHRSTGRRRFTAGLSSCTLMVKAVGPRLVSGPADLTTEACDVESASVQHVLLDTTPPPSSCRLRGTMDALVKQLPMTAPYACMAAEVPFACAWHRRCMEMASHLQDVKYRLGLPSMFVMACRL